jgi:sterol 3beta-glucosyltransferase
LLITILTGGSRGDTQPYIALGQQLKKEGYNIRFVAFKNFEDLILGLGFEFCPIQQDVKEIIDSEDVEGALKADNPFKVLLSFRKMKSLAYGIQKDFYDACKGSDIIIYHPGAVIGYFTAKKLGIPGILATPFPMTPTKEYPSVLLYKSQRGKRFNLLSHKMLERIMWFGSKSNTKRFWKEKFGSKPEDFGNPYQKQITETYPTITSCSTHVFPKPKDRSKHIHFRG